MRAWLSLLLLALGPAALPQAAGLYPLGGAVGKAASQAGAGLPLPPPNPQGEQLRLVNADEFRLDGTKLTAKGAVRLLYKGYDIQGDAVEGDTESQVFVVRGSAKVVGQDADIKGQEIEVDFRRRVYRFLQATAKVGPSQLGGEVTDDVFIQGDGGLGTSRNILTTNGAVTTCDLENPHFQLSARESEIIPGKVAKLRDVRLKILGATILRLPFLAIPLTEDSRRFVPQVGQTPDEGYFLKFNFGTALRAGDYLDHRVDLMQKLGIGLGTDWNYGQADRGMQGRIGGYFLNGPQPSRRLNLDHRMKLGRGDLTLGGQYQQNNYLTAPTATLTSGRAQYVLPWSGGTSRISFNINNSQTASFTSTNETLGISDSRRWRQGLDSQIDLTLFDAKSSSANFDSTSRRLDVRFNLRSEMRSLSADLMYQRSIKAGGNANFSGSSDRTPMLTLRSTSERLLGPRGRWLPVTMEAGIGELSEPGLASPITRMNLNLGVRREIGGRGPVSATLGAEYRQGLYSDDTAQYVLNYDSRLTWRFARQSNFNLNYRNLRAFGFTPLSLDRTGRNDAFNADLSHRFGQFSFSAQTGYDVLNADRGVVPWQTVSLRSEWIPDPLVRLRTTASYDTFSQVWGAFQLDSDFRLLGASWTLGARYDGRRQQFAGASVVIQGLKLGKVTASSLFDYNGYTKQFEAMHFALAYDLHCTEAVLEVIDNRVGFRSGRQIAFYIRIKAFPNFSPFGAGNRGQAVGGGFGVGG